MFDPEELAHVVALQEKSYGLLRWVQKALRKETLRFDVAHEALSASAAAREWISRHLTSIPHNLRPAADELDVFAHLFASYLMTSFELRPSPRIRQIPLCRCCTCPLCSYLVADYLVPRRLSKKAKGVARDLKRIYLTARAAELGVPEAPARVARALAAPELQEELALATYGAELLRRAEFSSQGEGVLALWREFAWEKAGSPRKDFRLSAPKIVEAEQALCRFLRAA
jgi:hypothetical protein